jgi:tRNA A-37 threonylcarbamoyl transferase component Bud32
MFKKIPLPPPFSLVKREKVFLLLKDTYKDFLLQQGIEDLNTFLKNNRQQIYYLNGRTPHPSVPLQDGKRMVLRLYSHGGLLRIFTRDLYLFGSRSFRELALTEEIRSCGLLTVEPIGAIHRILFPPFYKACLLSLEIPQSVNLIQYLQELDTHPGQKDPSSKQKMIRSAGLLLRQFHQEGFLHGDLQLKNILWSEDRFLLIDFDRTHRKPTLSTREKMKDLLRLNRSVEKWKRLGLPISRTDRWRFFKAYAGDDPKMRKGIKEALWIYSIRSFLHRFAWAIESWVKKCVHA